MENISLKSAKLIIFLNYFRIQDHQQDLQIHPTGDQGRQYLVLFKVVYLYPIVSTVIDIMLVHQVASQHLLIVHHLFISAILPLNVDYQRMPDVGQMKTDHQVNHGRFQIARLMIYMNYK